MRRHPRTARSCSQGFTLIEALLALVVLSVGLLGGVVLLLEGLRTSRAAVQRTMAVTLAADLAERIRANRAAGGAYALARDTTLPPPGADCNVVGECGPRDVAAVDLQQWQAAVTESLPEPMTEVTVDPDEPSGTCLYTITLRWSGSRESDSGTIALTVRT